MLALPLRGCLEGWGEVNEIIKGVWVQLSLLDGKPPVAWHHLQVDIPQSLRALEDPTDLLEVGPKAHETVRSHRPV